MRPIRLPAQKLIRCRTEVAAAEIMAGIPEGRARRDGTEVTILQPLDMTFSIPVDRPAPAAPTPFAL